METNSQKNDQNIIPNDADKPQKGVNVPNLRFRQFQNIWIKKSLHDITKKINIKNKNKECKNVICNSAQLGLIKQIDFFDKEIARDGSIKNYTIIKKNDFVYNPRKSLNAPYGPVNIYNYEEAGIISPLYLCFSVHDIDKIFLHYYFKSQAWYRFIYLNGDSGARHDRVSIKDKVFFSQNLYLPKAIEQEKIGVFLTLIDQRIDTQSKIIEKYKSLINTIRTNIFNSFQGKWTKLCNLVENKSLQLNRGNIIPKHPKDDVYKYPVYSSSVQKDGLMGYSDYYTFDKELITWSIDGGGDIFFREKHKFCITNVCGILQLDTNKFSYRFVAEALKYQHSKMTFNYQTKAHPSVIEKLYALPNIELNEQDKYSKLFGVLYSKLGNEQKYLEKLKEQKKYLLSNMFI